LHERVGRFLEVDREYGARVPGERLAFGRVGTGVEEEVVTLDDKPHGSNQRAAIRGDPAELAGAGSEREKVENRLRQFSHTAILPPGGGITG
jgi:hypothetical protein